MSEQAMLSTSNQANALMSMFFGGKCIQPGDDASYQMCKDIYAYHPLGKVLADKPIELALSQEREITIKGSPEDALVEAFKKTWEDLGIDAIISSCVSQARVYGACSVVYGAKGIPTHEALDLSTIEDKDLYFNVTDPLNTAGSLVTSQDPNAPDFQKVEFLRVNSQVYHPSRSCTVKNEDSLYILFTSSAFGYTGRSIYQRALYPLQSFIISMLTDGYILEKSGLLVWKGASSGNYVDNLRKAFGAEKREQIKMAHTGNVLQLGPTDTLESIDLKNLKDPTEFARSNVLKNIATSANMPASLVNQETLAEGFGEGSEDAKNIANYIAGIRIEMNALYKYFDKIVMHKAWGPTFYQALQNDREEYKSVSYATAFTSWQNVFKAKWPNLLVEPDSEKVKVEEVQLKAAIAAYEVMVNNLDPENKAILAQWLADKINECKLIASTPLILNMQSLKNYIPPMPQGNPEPRPESYET